MTKVTKFRTAYGPKSSPGVDTGNDTIVQQHFREECDINFIVDRFKRTGLVEHVRSIGGQFMNVVDFPDYHEALNTVAEARSRFLELPATVRERFNHDPGQMIGFLANPANREEAVELGLMVPQEAPRSETPSDPAEQDPAPVAPDNGS